MHTILLLILWLPCILISCNQGKTIKPLTDTLHHKETHLRKHSDTLFFPTSYRQFSDKIILLNARSTVFNDSLDFFYTKQWISGKLSKEMNMNLPFESPFDYKISSDTLTVNMMHLDYYGNKYKPTIEAILNDTICLGIRIVGTFEHIYPCVIHLSTWQLKIIEKSKKCKPVIFFNPRRCG